MKRTPTRELLDDDLGSLAQIEKSFSDLRHINRWFGGVRTTADLIRRIAQRSGVPELSVVDVGAGRGDLLLDVQRIVAKDGIRLRVTLIDRLGSHLPRNGTPSIVGDALDLPLGDGTFDVVTCCLFSHHFEPSPLEAFARSAFRVCRKAVLINDLIRSRIHLALTYAGLPLFRSRITWNDAPASVRQAYTMEEIAPILAGVNAPRMELTRHYLYRMGVILWK